MSPLDFLTLAAATLYLSFALTKTHGPFRLFATLRQKAPLGGLTSCIVCAAPWLAGLGYVLLETPLKPLVYVFAVAGVSTAVAYYVGMAQQ